MLAPIVFIGGEGKHNTHNNIELGDDVLDKMLKYSYYLNKWHGGGLRYIILDIEDICLFQCTIEQYFTEWILEAIFSQVA